MCLARSVETQKHVKLLNVSFYQPTLVYHKAVIIMIVYESVFDATLNVSMIDNNCLYAMTSHCQMSIPITLIIIKPLVTQ